MKEVSDKVDEMLGKEQKPDDDPLDDPKFLKGFDTGREVQMDAIDRCVDYLEESDNEDAEIMESLQEQLNQLKQ